MSKLFPEISKGLVRLALVVAACNLALVVIFRTAAIHLVTLGLPVWLILRLLDAPTLPLGFFARAIHGSLLAQIWIVANSLLWGFTLAWLWRTWRQRKRSPGRKWLAWTCVAAAVGIPILLIIGFIAMQRHLAQGLVAPYRAIYRSPAFADTELWLVKEGFVDRGMVCCVKLPGQPAVRVGHLDSESAIQFQHVKWSADGQVVAFALNVGQQMQPSLTVYGVAYDFSTRKAILSLYRSDPPTKWQEHEKGILALVAAHGGFASGSIDRQQFDKDSVSISYRLLP